MTHALGAERPGLGIPLLVPLVWLIAADITILHDITTEITHEMGADGGGESGHFFERRMLLDDLMTGGGPDPDDHDFFRTVIYRAIVYAGIPMALLADKMQVSEATVARWLSAAVTPHRLMIQTFYSLLGGLLGKK